MQNLNILQQLIARLRAKSPKLFQVITTISAIAAFVTGIPELLDHFGVVLPEALAPLANKAVAICATIVTVISSLTVDTPKATKNVITNVASGVDPDVAKRGS